MESSDDEEDLAFYGTPLDPIEEGEIPSKKPIIIEDQFAKDEHGRRRFHGAFTGGFSAGFCNTVGSLEGWRPSNFKSTRSTRAESTSQSIFDFMDDEDKGQHGICPMSIKVKPSFDDKTSESGVRKRARELASKGPIPGIPVAHQIFAPVRDTIGVKLLVKMGWRPGQGVGPKITRRKKKALQKEQKQKKVYSCSLPPGFSKEDESEESDYDIDFDGLTFAPDDYKPYITEPKQNVFGLGYKGMDRKLVLSSGKSSPSNLTVNGRTIRGQAFGVSVFEDDDDDIYTTDDMSNYDFTMDPEEKIEKKHSTSYGCIEGFHIANKPLKLRETFPLPTIPIDFVPLKSRKNRWGDAGKPVAKSKIKTVEERMQIINDKAPSTLKMTEADAEAVINEKDDVPTTSDYSFKPFTNDENKQARYEKYLKFRKLGVSDCLSTIQPPTMTEWEKEREKSEFEQVARDRPMSNDMADRFTSRGFEDNVHNILEPVSKTCNPEEQCLKDAVAKKMYGLLTRKKFSWVPDRVLCKRFNVPEPGLSSLEKSIENTKNQKHTSNSIFEFLKSEVMSDGIKFDIAKEDASVKTKPVQEIETATDNPLQVEEELDNEPADDIPAVTDKTNLFKAIFLDSSESEGEEEETILRTNVQKYEQQFIQEEKFVNKQKLQYSPPRGIFANLDLDSFQKGPTAVKTPDIGDSINSWEKSSGNCAKDKYGAQITVSGNLNSNMYGPQLPTSINLREVNKCSWEKKDEKSEEWVEKSHKHKSKKSKKHKHKKK